MSLPPEYFARLWADDDDPWRIAERWYERRKRDLVMACLPRERFGSALEVGCAAGHLTERLAARCDEVLAVDVDARAVGLTRERVARGARAGEVTGKVTVQRRQVPEQWPEQAFDLVVVSEVGYYLGALDLGVMVEHAVAGLHHDGVLVACHWRHDTPEYPGDADLVHARLAAAGLARCVRHEEPDLLLDVWTAGESSVARHEGWLT